MAGDSRPFPLGARGDPKVAPGGFDVEMGRRQTPQPFLDLDRIAADFLPFADRIFAVQITGPDDLFRIGLRRRPGLCRKFRRRKRTEGPAVGPLLLAPFEDVAERLAGDQDLADPGRIDPPEMGQRIGGMEVDPPVEMSAEFLLARRLETKLAHARFPEERAIHVDGEPHPLERVHPRCDDLLIEDFREPQRGMIILDQNHVPLPEAFLPGRFQAPQQHIGVSFQVSFV